jgi:hypothetical protein
MPRESCLVSVPQFTTASGRPLRCCACPLLPCSVVNILLANLGHSHKRVKAAALGLLSACLSADAAALAPHAAALLPRVLELVPVATGAAAADVDAVVHVFGTRLQADTFAGALLPCLEVR